MRRWPRFLALAIALLLVVGTGRLDAEDELDAETRALLEQVRKDKGPGTWLAAVRTLKAGTATQRKALTEVLVRLCDRRRPRLKRAVAALDALAARVGGGESARKRMIAWDAKRKRAVRWVFDPISFPAPPSGYVNGPEQGSAEARKRCDEAVAAYAELRKALDKAVGPALDLRSSQADALVVDHAIAYLEVAGVLEELRGLAEAPAPLSEPAPLAMLLLDARLGRYAVLARDYAALPDGWVKLCVFHAYARAVLRFNAEHPLGMTDKAVETVRRINEVRVALGVSPIAHNRKLVRTAKGHTAEMHELGYWAHTSPVPERRTSAMRAALEGYEGDVTECLAQVRDPRQALTIWFWDGGHLRAVLHPHWHECGLSGSQPVTWNAGADAEGARPGIRYRWPAKYDANR
jgi:hypothetical protein